ncbi:DNA fragmentation factor subunit alpha [Colius striatus]|uniref:DNA fragmentation factor subunit alpha n=1 Tax=Colius striatus TaxID=57412 RepID=UPI002B1D32C4|nr:DNA fragmentation factor subunit alpha [Colius striatus]
MDSSPAPFPCFYSSFTTGKRVRKGASRLNSPGRAPLVLYFTSHCAVANVLNAKVLQLALRKSCAISDAAERGPGSPAGRSCHRGARRSRAGPAGLRVPASTAARPGQPRAAMAAARKRCVVRRRDGSEQHGVAASCLRELRDKARTILAIDNTREPITLVLAEDGTIVDDEDYFLCLPSNTKFVALAKNEKWSSKSLDSGTAWLSESVDEVDSGVEKWKQLARQLKDDLSNIILMSEEDLQVLIDVPRSDLAEELAQSQSRVQVLQDTLQQVLDRREEERQSRQLLELYLEALKKEDSILSKVAGSETVPRKEMDVVDTGTSSTGTSAQTALSDHLLAALKKKPAPELCLDSQDLELVLKEDTQALAAALQWDKQKAEALQQACDQELSKRLHQVQTLHSLRSTSKGKKTLPWGDWPTSKRKK